MKRKTFLTQHFSFSPILFPFNLLLSDDTILPLSIKERNGTPFSAFVFGLVTLDLYYLCMCIWMGFVAT